MKRIAARIAFMFKKRGHVLSRFSFKRRFYMKQKFEGAANLLNLLTKHFQSTPFELYYKQFHQSKLRAFVYHKRTYLHNRFTIE